MKTILSLCLLVAALAGTGAILALKTSATGDSPAAPSEAAQSPLFIGGTGGYHTFRIPSLIATKRGTLLAFSEGRRNGGGDSGDIDLVLRRSTDNGRTWGPMKVVWNDGPNTCGNPCPVIDASTGTIWLLMTHNLGADSSKEINAATSRGTRTAWVCSSSDDGVTWSTPKEITGTVKRPDWTWYATGPGIGIQIRRGAHRGRMVIPCNHVSWNTHRSCSHVIYSDDHGKTWRLGGVCPEEQTNESQVAELSDGRLMLNMRSTDTAHKERAVCISPDGGTTWTDFHYDPTLIEPFCQASLITYAPDARGEHPLLFSNPADTSHRQNMTVRLSRDDGKTWPAAQTLYTGPVAYSSLATLPDGKIGCLYERGVARPYESITFARFSLAWLNGGRTAAH